jgi:hypothetical protein
LWGEAIKRLSASEVASLKLYLSIPVQQGFVTAMVEEIQGQKKKQDEKRWFYINKGGEQVFWVELHGPPMVSTIPR